jgi:hypothetical protein
MLPNPVTFRAKTGIRFGALVDGQIELTTAEVPEGTRLRVSPRGLVAFDSEGSPLFVMRSASDLPVRGSTPGAVCALLQGSTSYLGSPTPPVPAEIDGARETTIISELRWSRRQQTHILLRSPDGAGSWQWATVSRTSHPRRVELILNGDIDNPVGPFDMQDAKLSAFDVKDPSDADLTRYERWLDQAERWRYALDINGPWMQNSVDVPYNSCTTPEVLRSVSRALAKGDYRALEKITERLLYPRSTATSDRRF